MNFWLHAQYLIFRPPYFLLFFITKKRWRVCDSPSNLYHPLQNCGQIYFNIFRYILAKACLIWWNTRYIKNKNYLVNNLNWIRLAFEVNGSQGRNPSKVIFQNMWFFEDLDFPLVIYVNKSLNAKCLSSKMMYQHLLYPPSLWTYRHFKVCPGSNSIFNGNFRGC